MRIGVPVEIKNKEHRVALTPEGVHSFIGQGHTVYIEKGAGLPSGITNEDYLEVGAVIVDTAKEVWDCDMVIKVKEPLEEEFKYFREGLILFTYLHLANEEKLTRELLAKKVNAIGYETVSVDNNLPLLTPMSEVAGRMAPIIGSQFLQQSFGGKGILLGAVPGVQRGTVTIIGGGNVGLNAAKMAVGLGAHVNILDLSPRRLKELDDLFGNDIQTLISNSKNIADSVKNSDLVIGAVLLPGGAKAPRLVTEEMVKTMKKGSVIVDVAIDQGGIFETTDRVTTHDDPTYIKHGVVHYAVANIPGAVPRTSTYALTNATLPFALKIAKTPLLELAKNDYSIATGINTYGGKLTLESVSSLFGIEYTDIKELY
ncbi:MAG: alanine dehydrogenase [Tissierellia bacterium]|nr:alanine dehydrogenase [Tissierellia bacterium]